MTIDARKFSFRSARELARVSALILIALSAATGARPAPRAVSAAIDDETQGARRLGSPRGARSFVRAIGWSPDGSSLVAGYEDGTVRRWTENEARPLATFRAHDGSVTDLAWSPDGRRYATGSPDKVVKIWNAADDAYERALSTPESRYLAWSPDGALLATRGDDFAIALWDTSTWLERERVAIESAAAYSRYMSWSPDSTRIALSGGNRSLVTVWDVAKRQITATFRPPGSGAGGRVLWGPGGRTVAQDVFDVGVVVGNPDGTGETRTLIPQRGWTTAQYVDWNSARDLIAATYSSGETVIWNADAGSKVARFRFGNGPADLVAWRPDGKVLAVVTRYEITFWRVE